MKLKGIIDEDFINYKNPCMVIEFPYCDFKCDKEAHSLVCQNGKLVKEPDIELTYDEILTRYIENPISEALVFQGLEPMYSPADVMNLILFLREKYYCNDEIIIYTGYTEEELKWFTNILKTRFENIIIKFGRYIPNQTPHYDEILGIMLASDNQYAKKIIKGQ